MTSRPFARPPMTSRRTGVLRFAGTTTPRVTGLTAATGAPHYVRITNVISHSEIYLNYDETNEDRTPGTTPDGDLCLEPRDDRRPRPRPLRGADRPRRLHGVHLAADHGRDAEPVATRRARRDPARDRRARAGAERG